MLAPTLELSSTLAWRNLWRHPRRTWFTVMAISFSTFLLLFVIPNVFGFYDTLIDTSTRVFTGHAQVQHVDYLDQPHMHHTLKNASALLQKLENSPGVDAMTSRAMGMALLSSEKRTYGVQIVGVDPLHEPQTSTIPKSVNVGRFLAADRSYEIVIGKSLAKNLRVQIGDELTLLGSGHDGSVAAAIFTVVGTFESGDVILDRLLAEVRLHDFQEVYSMGDRVHTLVVISNNTKTHALMLQQLQSRLEQIDQDQQITVRYWKELMPGIEDFIQVHKISRAIMLSVMMLIVLLGIFNTFLMATLERVREFGLLLALGLRPAVITRTMMLEALMLSIIGLAIGATLGGALLCYLSQNGLLIPGMQELTEQFHLPINRLFPQLNLLTVGSGPLAVLLTANLVAWIPLWRIHRLQPVEAMRTI